MRSWARGIAALTVGVSLVSAYALAQQGPPPAPGSDRMEMARRGGDERGWGHDGREHRWMSPEQICKEHFARRTARLAYIGARLELTQQQQPLWDAYRQAMTDAATKRRDACIADFGRDRGEGTILERRDRLERMLRQGLDSLQATKAPLDALYQSLSPEQRAVLDRRHHHRG